MPVPVTFNWVLQGHTFCPLNGYCLSCVSGIVLCIQFCTNFILSLSLLTIFLTMINTQQVILRLGWTGLPFLYYVRGF